MKDFTPANLEARLKVKVVFRAWRRIAQPHTNSLDARRILWLAE
jgi:hypothetical protein